MNKIEMINTLKSMIEADPSLAVSEWQGTFTYEAGEMTSMKLEDLNGIEMEGMPAPKPGELKPVEMSVVAAANCFSLTFHVEAYNAGIAIDKAQIVFTGKFDKAPFLGISEGNSGMTEPTLELTVDSSTSKEDIEKIALIALKRSPVLSSFKEQVVLNFN